MSHTHLKHPDRSNNGMCALGSTNTMKVTRSNCEKRQYGSCFALHLAQSGSRSSGGRRIKSVYIENNICRRKFRREHQGGRGIQGSGMSGSTVYDCKLNNLPLSIDVSLNLLLSLSYNATVDKSISSIPVSSKFSWS